MINSIIVPQTYLARDLSEALARCFDQVYLLGPPDLSEDQEGVAGWRPEVFNIFELSRLSEDISFQPGKLKDLMHQWEAWIASQRGSGNIETMKAGVKPQPPDRETTRAIMNQVRTGRTAVDQPNDHPSAPPGLVLHLAHLLDKQEAEIRSLADGIDSQQEHMSESLGLNQEEEPPAEFQKIASRPLRPMGLETEDESLIAYRLQAWASLAPLERIKDLTPLTLSPRAALLLLERANLVLGGEPVRSAAGVQNLLWPPVSLSTAGITLAREALRMRMPDPEEAAAFKDALSMMLGVLAGAPLSSDLLKSLQEIGGAWLKSGDPQKPGGGLGLMVFPGYSLAGLLDLMKGRSREPDNPGASCPLWVLW